MMVLLVRWQQESVGPVNGLDFIGFIIIDLILFQSNTGRWSVILTVFMDVEPVLMPSLQVTATFSALHRGEGQKMTTKPDLLKAEV